MPDRVDHLIREALRRQVAHPGIGTPFADLVLDGVEQMGLAEPGVAEDEHRVVHVARLLGHGDAGGMGEAVPASDHEGLEGSTHGDPGSG